MELSEFGEWMGIGWNGTMPRIGLKIQMRYAMRCPKMKQESRDKKSGWGSRARF